MSLEQKSHVTRDSQKPEVSNSERKKNVKFRFQINGLVFGMNIMQKYAIKLYFNRKNRHN